MLKQRSQIRNGRKYKALVTISCCNLSKLTAAKQLKPAVNVCHLNVCKIYLLAQSATTMLFLATHLVNFVVERRHAPIVQTLPQTDVQWQPLFQMLSSAQLYWHCPAHSKRRTQIGCLLRSPTCLLATLNNSQLIRLTGKAQKLYNQHPHVSFSANATG